MKLGTGSHTVNIESTHTGSTSITSRGGNDTFNVRTISGHTDIETGDGSDTLNVAGHDQTLDRITGLLSLNADGSNDTLNLNDSADDNDNSAVLTNTTLTGLDMPSVAEVQTIRVQGTGGQFQLAIQGQASTEKTLNFGATAAELATALEELYGAQSGDIAVTRTADGANAWIYTVTFVRHLVGQNVASLVWAETASDTLLTGTSEISKDVRINTNVEGTTSPVVNSVQTIEVSATGGQLKFAVAGQTVTIDYDNLSKTPLKQLSEALELVLNPNNSNPNLPYTYNYAVRQFGNTFEIEFRGAHSTTSITSIDTSELTGSATLATRTTGINYYGFATVNLNLGSGNDQLNVRSTALGSTYNIDTAAGNDVVNISSDANANSGTADLVRGDINLNAGSGTNRLVVSDITDTTADTISLTRVADSTEKLKLSGMATADVVFSALGGNYNGGLVLSGGSGNNQITIGAVFRDASLVLNAGMGHDTVTVTQNLAGTDGRLTISGQDGNDRIDASVADQTVVLDGGLGNDSLVGGSANDTLQGGLGNDLIEGRAGDDLSRATFRTPGTLRAFAPLERLITLLAMPTF